MKKLIIFAILFIGLRVQYHGHKISVTSGQTVYANQATAAANADPNFSLSNNTTAYSALPSVPSNITACP